MSDVVIRAVNLGKRYSIAKQAEREGYVALRDVIARKAKTLGQLALNKMSGRESVTSARSEEFWALQGVDLEVHRGDVVGIIGRNGAGKSTLLKILSRITEPSLGRVEIHGRVASLLEVGTGFHPELSGRENIYLNGAILGMTRAEIKRKFDEIVDFSEVEKFLDTPVKRYSSGMYVRLAFAVAAHLEPEVLVVDEVLAVGDAQFQKKCLGKMQDVAGHGRTVLFVSHNMAAVASLCNKGLFLSKGKLVGGGTAQQALEAYQNEQTLTGSIGRVTEGFTVDITSVGSSTTKANTVDVNISIKNAHEEEIIHLSLLLYSQSGVRVLLVDLRSSMSLPRRFAPGRHEIMVEFGPVALVEQEFEFGVFLQTNSFSGDLMSLRTYSAPAKVHPVPPYPAIHRGFVDVDVTAQVSRNER